MTRSTLDTNVAVYAFSPSSQKAGRAAQVLLQTDFASVQLLNEFAHVARRKMKLEWHEVADRVDELRTVVKTVRPLDAAANADALRLASRYQLTVYDSLMLSVALAGGASTFYSEDMQHGLVIDGTLRIVDPFRLEAQ